MGPWQTRHAAAAPTRRARRYGVAWEGHCQLRLAGFVAKRRDIRTGGNAGGKKNSNADVRLMPVATVQGPHAPGPARVTARLRIAQGLPDTQWHSAT